MAAFQTLLGLGTSRTPTSLRQHPECDGPFEPASSNLTPTYGGVLKQPDKHKSSTSTYWSGTRSQSNTYAQRHV
jgi:hypothetical protein